MYNRMKLLAGKKVFDKEFKTYFYPLTLDFIAEEFEEEILFLNPMNILSMDEYDLKFHADKIMDNSKDSAEPIKDLVLTRYQIIMIYIITGIREKNPESFLQLIKGFSIIFEKTFGSKFKFNMEEFTFTSKDKVIITKIINSDGLVKTQLEDFLIINEDNFERVCDSIKEVNGWNVGTNEDKPEYNPINEKARKIAEKLNKARKKIQNLKAKDSSKDEVTLTDFISSYSTQAKININEVYGTYTLFQFFMQSARESLYFEYNTNIQAMLHGASDVELKNWSKKIN